jgi:hypothetical protein
LEDLAVSIFGVQEAQEEWINLFKYGSNGNLNLTVVALGIFSYHCHILNAEFLKYATVARCLSSQQLLNCVHLHAQLLQL